MYGNDCEAECVLHVRVLLADDHPVVRELIGGLLREHGIDVVAEAEDGEQAVEMALENHPDVIVMDVSMPILDGLEATRRIMARLPLTRIIGLSTHEYAEMAPAMFEAGAVAYVTKTQSGDLIDAIMRLAGDTGAC